MNKERYREKLVEHSNQAEEYIKELRSRGCTLKNKTAMQNWGSYKDGIDRAIELLDYETEDK